MKNKLYLIRHVLFWCIVGSAVLLYEIKISESAFKPYGFAALVVIAFFVYRLVINRKIPTEQEQKGIDRVVELQQSKTPLAYEQQEPLTTDDLRKLKYSRYFLMLTFFSCALIFGGVGVFLVGLLEFQSRVYLQWLIAILSVIGFAYLGSINVRKFDAHVKSGLKTVVRGIVTGKEVDTDEDREDYYYLKIDDLSVKVKKKIYRKYEIGDGIELHIFKPWYNTFLHEKKIT